MKSKIRLQPLVNLRNKNVFGYEALYQKQNNKDKYPSAVRILEEIYNSCSGEKKFHIFINMTTQDLLSRKLVSKLAKLVKRDDIDIVFEINENTSPDLFEQSIPTLLAIKELGVKIALDDFGLNYSIVNFTKNIQFDFVKIDQSLVQQSVVNEHAMELLTALVNAANNTGSAVIAEGIETIEQLNCATKSGIKIGQGFLFSAQRESSFVPLDDFYRYLSESEAAA